MKNSSQVGTVLAVVSLCLFGIYILCFAAILIVNEPYLWTNIQEFAAHEAASQTIFKYTGMVCMLLFFCAFVGMVACVQPRIAKESMWIFHIALAFALAFCIAISLNYFVQASATRLQLEAGYAEGLEQLTQTFSISAINAVNMLGWTVFFPISTLALAAVLKGQEKGKPVRIFCLANTAIMLLGCVGYLANQFYLLFVTMNLGLGITGIGLTIALRQLFRRGINEAASIY